MLWQGLTNKHLLRLKTDHPCATQTENRQQWSFHWRKTTPYPAPFYGKKIPYHFQWGAILFFHRMWRQHILIMPPWGVFWSSPLGFPSEWFFCFVKCETLSKILFLSGYKTQLFWVEAKTLRSKNSNFVKTTFFVLLNMVLVPLSVSWKLNKIRTKTLAPPPFTVCRVYAIP